MARPRKTTNDDILDAAERVVARLGAAGLSIDAVAKEAGVSKAMVVYDHKSKKALLEALVDRRVKADMAYVDQCVANAVDTPHPELFGRIASAEKKLDEIERTARAKGFAIATGFAFESTIDAVTGWAAEAKKRGIEIVPISALASDPER